MATFILKRDSLKNYYWILRSNKNFKIIAKSSESYEQKNGATESIAWTRVNAKEAGFTDET
ncbi:MAG: DUF1508 domain-containing protein [Candidatus Buchananbacteria bacterium]|jgi:uncharacterized protein YegP (UPF0339 family)